MSFPVSWWRPGLPVPEGWMLVHDEALGLGNGPWTLTVRPIARFREQGPPRVVMFGAARLVFAEAARLEPLLLPGEVAYYHVAGAPPVPPLIRREDENAPGEGP